MKKLMIAAVAIAAGAVFADEIQSANVVGYAQTQGRYGTKSVGTQFAVVGTGDMDLQELIATGYTKPYIKGGIYLQPLDSAGVDIDTYLWFDNDEYTQKGKTVPARYGWYYNTNKTTKVTGVTLKLGEGILLTVPDETYGVRSSGQVITDPYKVWLRYGSKQVANSTPVDVDIQSVIVSDGYTGSYIKGGIYLQPLDSAGVDTDTYLWFDNDEYTQKGKTVPARYGWYYNTNKTTKVMGVTIKAGESIQATAPDTTWALQFPGVSLSK